jgi:hypothetical protein
LTKVAEDRLGVVRVDPHPACGLAGFAARVRFQVGDHFAAAGSARRALAAGGVAGRSPALRRGEAGEVVD